MSRKNGNPGCLSVIWNFMWFVILGPFWLGWKLIKWLIRK